MITQEEIKKSKKIVTSLINEGSIVPAEKNIMLFFLGKAEKSLETAYCLLQISGDEDVKKRYNITQTYEGYMWVINSSYYAMFYAATALLAKYNHRIKKEQGLHMLTYHALVYYFLDNDKKMAMHLLEQYKYAEEESLELLQMAEEKAKQQIENIKLELEKRRIFTYEMGVFAEKKKAETSLKRAQEFVTGVKQMLW